MTDVQNAVYASQAEEKNAKYSYTIINRFVLERNRDRISVEQKLIGSAEFEKQVSKHVSVIFREFSIEPINTCR